MPERSELSLEEMTLRSIYMRVAASMFREDQGYPARLCDPELLNRIVDKGHATIRDGLVQLTISGLRWWANLNRGQIYSKYSQNLLQIRWLSQFIEIEEVELGSVHVDILRTLYEARCTSKRVVPASKLPKVGLKHLVNKGLAQKHNNGTYSITGNGVAVLRRQYDQAS